MAGEGEARNIVFGELKGTAPAMRERKYIFKVQ